MTDYSIEKPKDYFLKCSNLKLDAKFNVLHHLSGADACDFYRYYQPAYYINKREDINWVATNYYGPDDLDNNKFCAIIHQRQCKPYNRDIAKRSSLLGIKNIYEIDDDFFHLSIYNPVYTLFRNRLHEFKAFYESVDMMVCTTDPLREQLLQYNKNVTIIPNAIDFELFHMKLWKKDYNPETIIIGWTGSSTHYQDLLQCEDAVTKVILENPNTKLLIGGGKQLRPVFKGVPDDRKIVIPWTTLDKYPEMLTQIDIGICPLEDTIFNQSKSNLKYIELSALGIPSICSKVYPYANTVTNNVNGVIVKNRYKDWYKELSAMVKDAFKRVALGTAAQELVKANYNQEKITNLWYELLTN